MRRRCLVSRTEEAIFERGLSAAASLLRRSLGAKAHLTRALLVSSQTFSDLCHPSYGESQAHCRDFEGV